MDNKPQKKTKQKKPKMFFFSVVNIKGNHRKYM